MDKDAMIKLEDSNIANLGSELEEKIRLAAGEKEEAWKNSGKQPGIEIWRIEKFNVVRWPKDQYGYFYSGDSYIILNTYLNKGSDALHWNAHMWVGQFTTMDEAGTAAYKIVELDTLFNRNMVLYRESQGYETELFSSYFKSIKILDGGIESGFKHVPVEQYKPKLLHVKGKKNLRVREVPLLTASLNSNDVFILDNGRTIYIWKGKSANSFEKFKSASVVEEIKAERIGKENVITLDEGDDDEDFWKLLGGKGEIRKDEENKDDVVEGAKKVMYHLSDSTGKLEFKEVNYAKDSLNTKDVFIIDTSKEILAWIGKESSQEEKSSALKYAEKYIKDHSRPANLPLCIMSEGREGANFFQIFI